MITNDIKHIRKCASIWSANLTFTGLASNSDLVILNVSSIFDNPLYIFLNSKSLKCSSEVTI